jgi:hypothetical protein
MKEDNRRDFLGLSTATAFLAILSAVLVFIGAAASRGDWSPRLAAQFLDSRQKAWFAWPPANKSGVSCLSCHTGLPYLLGRPALRRALGEHDPTLYEALLIDGVRATAIKTDGTFLFGDSKGLVVDQEFGSLAILSALVLAMDDAPRGRLSPEEESAFERLWALQLRAGENKGAWYWSEFDLDPWETPHAMFYGAALAAVATGAAPAGYQFRPPIRENVAALTGYLRGTQKSQPLHDRLTMLWAAAVLRDLLPQPDRQAILDEVWAKQQADGGWSIDSLGPWKSHPKAPPAHGSNSYATGLVAFTLQQAGVQSADPRLARALSWLKARQDRQSGAWVAQSMNHPHEAGSMPALFMEDAATGYAAAALAAAGTQ